MVNGCSNKKSICLIKGITPNCPYNRSTNASAESFNAKLKGFPKTISRILLIFRGFSDPSISTRSDSGILLVILLMLRGCCMLKFDESCNNNLNCSNAGRDDYYNS